MEADGFGGREAGKPAAFGEAETWVARRCLPLAGEPVETALVVGRVVAEAVAAGVDLPPFDRAAPDGHALRAEAAAGASAYNPLPVAATRVAAGDTLRPSPISSTLNRHSSP